jgi:hypothetical protein
MVSTLLGARDTVSRVLTVREAVDCGASMVPAVCQKNGFIVGRKANLGPSAWVRSFGLCMRGGSHAERADAHAAAPDGVLRPDRTQ